MLGKDIANYDSMLVLTHFKGHPMGGYGGALKQLSIGCASSAGKAYIHSGGKVKDQAVTVGEHAARRIPSWRPWPTPPAPWPTTLRGKIAYRDRDEEPVRGLRLLRRGRGPLHGATSASCPAWTPSRMDQRLPGPGRCTAADPGRDHFMERVNSRHGAHTIEAAEALGVGTTEYELVRV